MKKIVYLFLFVFLSMFFAANAGASEARFDFDGSETGFDPSFPDLTEAARLLPEEAEPEVRSFIDGDDDGKREAVSEKLKPSYWWALITAYAKESLLSGAGFLATALGLIIISSITENLLTGDSFPSLSGRSFNLTTLFLTLETARASSVAITEASGYIGRLCTMMNVLTPVMNALYVTSGRVNQMTVNSSSLMLFITVTQNLNAYVLVPFGTCVLALTATLGITVDSPAASLAESAKKILIGALSFMTAVFSFVMGIQSSLASGADTLASKTVKFAAESGVPVVGGAVSEAVTTVGASLSLMKKTAGGAAVVMILLIVVPTLIRALTFCFSLTLLKGASDLLGARSASAVISGARSVVSVFAALTVCAGILFIFAVTLFMNSGTV